MAMILVANRREGHWVVVAANLKDIASLIYAPVLRAKRIEHKWLGAGEANTSIVEHNVDVCLCAFCLLECAVEPVKRCL